MTSKRKERIIELQTWNESDHPRDNDGKFTEKGAGASSAADEPIDPRKIVYRQNTPYWQILEDDRKREEEAERRKNAARLPLDFFSKENRKKLTREDIPSEVYGFANDKLMTAHHRRHAREMGYKDPKQYEKGAIEFWRHGAGVIYASSLRNRIYKYDVKKGIFLSIGVDGNIRTFMIYSKRDFERKVVQEHLCIL